MNQEQILEFVSSNPMCHIATLDGNQPRVRGMMLYRADAAGLIFHTGKSKSLYKQLLEHKYAEACFNSKEKQVRVSGVVEIIDDLNLKKEIVDARPFMKPWIEASGYDSLAVFRMTHCEATVWTMATNFEPTQYQKI